MFKKYFLHQITFISASTSKKKSPQKKVITQRKSSNVKERKKKKRAKGAFLIFIHLCRKLRNSVPGRWLTKGSILIIDFHGFAERQKIVCGESHLNTTMGGSYTINNGEGSRIVSSVIIHPPPPPRNQLAIPSSELWKLKHKGHFQSPMLCYSASFPDR